MKFNLKNRPNCSSCPHLEKDEDGPLGCDADIIFGDLCPQLQTWFEGFEKELRKRKNQALDHNPETWSFIKEILGE